MMAEFVSISLSKISSVTSSISSLSFCSTNHSNTSLQNRVETYFTINQGEKNKLVTTDQLMDEKLKMKQFQSIPLNSYISCVNIWNTVLIIDQSFR